jgi:putative transcriptional regulator
MNKEKIAETLRELRGNNTRESVAKAVEISVSALSMYENGDRIPRDEVKLRLARYYEKTVGEIFFDDKVHFS